MGCYLGCRTVRNKILWGIFAVLAVLGIILISVGLAKIPVCRRQQPTYCQSDLARFQQATQQSRLAPACRQRFVNCFRPWFIMAAIGAALFAGAFISVCVMCCCSKAPKPAYATPAAGVQLTGQPVNNPYHATYEQQQQQMHPYGTHQPQGPLPPGAAAGPPAGFPYAQQQPYPTGQQQPAPYSAVGHPTPTGAYGTVPVQHV